MDAKGISSSNSSCDDLQNDQELEDQMGLRRGPWTVEEDITLINYIGHHGEGRWNSLARCAGLKRTGKSCRLRWLNYLRPDVRRGNITLEEQLLILELHSRWGNRWSKIAQHLPGRTDNEIKNYWRTRVQKHAKQLKCDVNSKEFKDTMRYLWMPRLVERIQAASRTTIPGILPSTTATTETTTTNNGNYHHLNNIENAQILWPQQNNIGGGGGSNFGGVQVSHSYTPENSSTAASSESWGISQVSPASELNDCYYPVNHNLNQDYVNPNNYQQLGLLESLTSPNTNTGYLNQGVDLQMAEPNINPWMDGGDLSDNLWNVDDDYWFMQQQLIGNNNI